MFENQFLKILATQNPGTSLRRSIYLNALLGEDSHLVISHLLNSEVNYYLRTYINNHHYRVLHILTRPLSLSREKHRCTIYGTDPIWFNDHTGTAETVLKETLVHLLQLH